MSLKNVEDIYTLSPLQQGILFHFLKAPESGIYFEQLVYTLHGDLNVSSLKFAWEEVLKRHQILRTGFVYHGLNEPLQVVYSWVNLPWFEQDWRELSPILQQEQLESFLAQERKQGFQLNQAPLMRCTLIHLANHLYKLVWSFHHLLLDGWSTPLVFQEVLNFYEAFSKGLNLCLESTRPYRDYIAWLQKQDIFQAELFWRKNLKNFTAPTLLAVGKLQNNLQNHQQSYDEQSLHLSTLMTSNLQAIARKNYLTLNTLLQGCWSILLSRYSSEKDVLFGVTVSGRPTDLSGVESMVGMFINTLPVRVQVDEDMFLLPWLEQLQSQQIEREQYSYSCLTDIQGWTNVPRGIPLFYSLMVFQNNSLNPSLRQKYANIEITDIQAWEKTNYPLTILVDVDSELSLKISYDTCCFDVATITRLIGHLQTLLTAISVDPHQQISKLPLLTISELHQLLEEWNDTHIEYSQDNCIHHLFEAQVERTPDAIAVVFGELNITYWELNCRANQLAHYLQSLGITSEAYVAVCLERSPYLLVGILGILKAGATYVPLDHTYPEERISFILNDTQASVLVTQQSLTWRQIQHKARVVYLDTDDWQTASQDNLDSHIQTANLAYILYTSGSTGQPKGVAISHSSTVSFLNWARKTYTDYQLNGVLASTSICFDLSIFEIFAPLCWGGKVILAENALHIADLPAVEDIILINTVPSAISELLRTENIPQGVNTVNLAGEPLSYQIVQQLYQRENIQQVFNLYGPSEATTYSTFTLIQKGTCESPSIGSPIANVEIYILDYYLRPVPIGVPGELYVNGLNLARGYLNRPSLTAEKFIPHPFSEKKGERLYKTGDIARYLSDGNIEFLGRSDYQVKIRGFRVELGEIEAALLKYPSVQETIVTAHAADPNDKCLVAYIILKQGTTFKTEELRSYLKDKLLSYMIPSFIIPLNAFPLTLNGKIDRHALPKPDRSHLELSKVFVNPRTLIEQQVADIWAEVLQLERVSIYDNFFDLGGHSLKATQVVSRIQETFQIKLSLQSFFETLSVVELSEKIQKIKVNGNHFSQQTIKPISRNGYRLKASSIEEVESLNRKRNNY